MNITLRIGLFTVLVMAKSHGSGVKFQLTSQKLTNVSVNNSAKQIHDLVAKNCNNNGEFSTSTDCYLQGRCSAISFERTENVL